MVNSTVSYVVHGPDQWGLVTAPSGRTHIDEVTLGDHKPISWKSGANDPSADEFGVRQRSRLWANETNVSHDGRSAHLAGRVRSITEAAGSLRNDVRGSAQARLRTR
jgi:hypothetical protein